ncbi:LPS assembly lipoprotein LptE [Photobacterium sp. DA100]|uniref:LPS-assembly lipoprotein LptE n=1 Tax=Photobacterium sp. DA100 TaxID=3027472 RepID=UPI00247987B4|nr:LPS assembly lipoprotein LptE [Photobacterium sp. DA100]WEM42912.1 LPS assembly lipoprotein LptE [Photobacterium sp. DA100]
MRAFISPKSVIRTFFVVLMALATASCGFHLRGNYMLPDDIAKLSLTSFDQYGQLHRQVKSQFQLHGIEPVAPSSRIPNLHLISESTSERTLSLYQNARAAEYELTYTVRYRIVVPEKGSQTYTTRVNRTFLDNPLTALAKSVERDMIEQEMREQASKQIMRQLARLTAVFNQLEEQELEALLEKNADSNERVSTELGLDVKADSAAAAGQAAKQENQVESAQ